MRKFIFRTACILVLAVVLGYIWVRPANQALVLYLTDTQTVGQLDIELNAKARTAFDEKFMSAEYFAAFAVGPNMRFAMATGRHSSEDARSEALAWCNKGAAGDCVIYAEKRPEGYSTSISGMTISKKNIGNNLINFLPIKGDVLYALGSDGSWAVQASTDGYYFPAYYLKRRCEDYQAKNSRPVYLPRTQCKVFRGPVNFVKK
jgi:hypothetical protein